MSRKPTLLQIRQHTHITTQQLATQAGVSLSQAYTVEIGGFSSEQVARQVVNAFVALSGQPLRLDDIRINCPTAPWAHASHPRSDVSKDQHSPLS